MLSTTPTARLVHILTDEDWNKAKRNSAARQIALMHSTVTDDPVITVREPIVQHGVVGRYDRGRAELLKVVAEASGCAAFVESTSFVYQGKRRRYSVRMYGHRSDIQRARQLYSDLISVALAHMMEITGESVMRRRREWFNEFVDIMAKRLQDVGAAPSVKNWLSEHHADAYAALGDNKPHHQETLAIPEQRTSSPSESQRVRA